MTEERLALDGTTYTWEQFVDYYGNESDWYWNKAGAKEHDNKQRCDMTRASGCASGVAEYTVQNEQTASLASAGLEHAFRQLLVRIKQEEERLNAILVKASEHTRELAWLKQSWNDQLKEVTEEISDMRIGFSKDLNDIKISYSKERAGMNFFWDFKAELGKDLQAFRDELTELMREHKCVVSRSQHVEVVKRADQVTAESQGSVESHGMADAETSNASIPTSPIPIGLSLPHSLPSEPALPPTNVCVNASTGFLGTPPTMGSPPPSVRQCPPLPQEAADDSQDNVRPVKQSGLSAPSLAPPALKKSPPSMINRTPESCGGSPACKEPPPAMINRSLEPCGENVPFKAPPSHPPLKAPPEPRFHGA